MPGSLPGRCVSLDCLVRSAGGSNEDVVDARLARNGDACASNHAQECSTLGGRGGLWGK
jgi:hypothetical protein